MVKWEPEEAKLGAFFRLKVGTFRGIQYATWAAAKSAVRSLQQLVLKLLLWTVYLARFKQTKNQPYYKGSYLI